MTGIVRSCPSYQGESAPLVYAYARDGPKSPSLHDWLALAATALKIVETGVLWRFADWQLSLASSISWVYVKEKGPRILAHYIGSPGRTPVSRPRCTKALS